MDYSYLAGLLDGDGSFSIVKPKRGLKMYIYIQLGQVLTEAFRQLGVEFDRPVYELGQPTKGNKTVGKMGWCGKDAEQLLDQIESHLRLKAAQARTLREFLLARETSDLAGMLAAREQLMEQNNVD